MSILLVAWLLCAEQQPPDAIVERAVLGLEVNGLAADDVAVATTGRQVWIPSKTLIDVGLAKAKGERRSLFGTEHVLLNSLAPAITFRLDESTFTLFITAEPSQFESATISLMEVRPDGMETGSTVSSVLNYQVFWNSDGGTSAVTDVGLTAYGSALASTLYINDRGRAERGLTTFTHDHPSKRVRLSVGDVTLRGLGQLASAPGVGGVIISRENTLDPYHQVGPMPQVSGDVTTPSTMEVFVNDRAAGSFDLLPGPYLLSNIPVAAGQSSVRVVVKEANGRTRELASRYYIASRALRGGEQDFAYGVGARRESRANAFTYHELVGVAGHRVGLNDHITLGYSAEGDRRGGTIGPVINLGLSRVGEIEVTGSYSRSGQAAGFAGSGSWQLTTHTLSVGVTGEWYDTRYVRPAETLGDRTRPWSASMSLSLPIWRALLQVRGADEQQIQVLTTDANGSVLLPGSVLPTIVTEVRRATASMSVPLVARSQFRVAGTETWDAATHTRIWEATIGVSFSLRGGVSVTTEATRSTGEQAVVTMSRSMPQGTGAGFQIEASAPVDGTPISSGMGRASIEAQNDWAHVTLGQSRVFSGTSTTSGSFDGGLALIGGVLKPGRSLTQSFALVTVPDAPNVRVFANHQLVGRTNRTGSLLVPSLEAFYGNIITIADADVPLEFKIDRTRAVVAPPFRGAATVLFGTTRVHTFTGTVSVVTAALKTVPSYGTLTLLVNGSGVDSPLNSEGTFYFENITPGRYQATVDDAKGPCVFEIVLPASTTLITDLGELTCPRTRSTGGSP